MSSYAIKDNDLILDGVTDQYVLKIRDLPNNKKPREKLLEHGPGILSVEELLAVLLGSGTKKEELMEMVSRITREYGEKSILSQKDPVKLAESLDIPPVKAMQIVVAGELGRRLYERNDLGLAVIRGPEDVYEYLREMETLPKEHLRGIYLNPHRRVIHDEVISIGTVSSNIIHPREVFKPAIEYGAVAVILAHNHPSGNVSPSEADIEITRQVTQAGRIIGIDLLDHVIIARGKFGSIKVDRSEK